jgi:2-polyprenyl-3-methyl-5-hydroxy-6-metoxy-1,4-benzoquinol methylase
LSRWVNELNDRGFNIRCVGATSDADLGERFELVSIGAVLQQVENPSALLRFAPRHVARGSKILAATPNPFSRKSSTRLLAAPRLP